MYRYSVINFTLLYADAMALVDVDTALKRVFIGEW